MNIEKLFVLLVASLFLGFGVVYFLYPDTMAALTGIELTTIPAKIDSWAIYAGVQIGFGVFLFRCVFGNESIRTALLAIMYMVGGIALLRFTGMCYYASFDGYSLIALMFEGPTAIVAWYFYLATRLE